MTLNDSIASRIRAEGPISVADYMAEALLHPTYGYYTTRDPLGRAGDFITAPEISQMFGELIGLALAQCWLDQGSPNPFTLAELGPGRGTLMADLLRATKQVPGFHDAMQITFLEASPTLRTLQAETLNAYAPLWLDTLAALPEQPLFLIANEFFDALPVRQFLRDGEGWREKSVGLQDGKLSFGLGAVAPQPALAHRLEDTRDDDLVELCEAAQPMVQTIAARIATHGGAALIVDYGDWRSLGDTLQALRAHAPSDPLDAPGSADLTTHVDFEALALTAQAAGCSHSRLTPQGVFLERLGITDRAQTLAARLEGNALQSLIAAHRRLTHPEEMGNVFKVLGIFPMQASPPPGLNA
ncbi:class I SAM-dependent methyltransferase [Phaeobacter gallaeciensis]|uniref:class I SAM-dependent methyltransferase n=1 Tax=Phaeobacter gallaeciensis TaxID=60890 RepID=UPI000BBC70FD|nr:SAM-dependent methyltransferase [Phaeobacter gallaeciensis]ATF17612.1 SAM-dependent methyltransferase [Phaeobacter gallaeciensis]ATF21721.1 SAM-dependent methyltransferase [Phaeobacter gallaeciensis]